MEGEGGEAFVEDENDGFDEAVVVAWHGDKREERSHPGGPHQTNKLESSSYENKDFDETTERIVYRFTLVKITGIMLFDVFHLNFRVFEAINKNTKGLTMLKLCWEFI